MKGIVEVLQSIKTLGIENSIKPETEVREYLADEICRNSTSKKIGFQWNIQQ